MEGKKSLLRFPKEKKFSTPTTFTPGLLCFRKDVALTVELSAFPRGLKKRQMLSDNTSMFDYFVRAAPKRAGLTLCPILNCYDRSPRAQGGPSLVHIAS